VDPLDGTNNVAIGLPVYAVGLALCEDGIPVVAVAHNPVTGETHSALRDGGLHGVVATRRRLGDDLILVWTQGHPVSRRDPRARALQTALDAEARRILRLWAPLLGWMMLAAGRVDGVVGYRAEMLEMPVGLLMARESGNVVVDLRGEPFDERFDVGERSFVACRPERLDRLLSLVAAAG
jgi:myo-inositol-1(or 4)-monophosphatase